MGFYRPQRKNNRDKQPPLFSAQVTENLGFACWTNEGSGLFEVKIGEAFKVRDRASGEQRLIIRTVVPLSAFGELPEAIEAISRMFENVSDLDVPESMRRDLGQLAGRLESAIVPSVESELKPNGATDHFARSVRQ